MVLIDSRVGSDAVKYLEQEKGIRLRWKKKFPEKKRAGTVEQLKICSEEKCLCLLQGLFVGWLRRW